MDYIIGQIEKSIINLASAVAPWLVLILTSYMTYWHSIKELEFPIPVALSIAVAVEILGFSSVRTGISFWEHNKRYSSDKNQAPIGLVVFTYAFYLVVVLSVNVLLNITAGIRWDKILAITLFNLLSVPAGLLVASRTQHRELLDALEDARRSRRTAKTIVSSIDVLSGSIERSNADQEHQERSENHASSFENEIVQFLEQTWENENRVPGPTEIAKTFGLNPDTNKGYISTRTKRWKAENGIQ
jgi:hypothetical protein